MPHTFSPEDVARAHSPDALAKAAETKRRRAQERVSFTLEARAYGWTVGRIANETGLTDKTVDSFLAGTEHRRRYGRGVIECPHDGH